MRFEIRNQPPGEPWPSGQAWEVPTPENLRAICADLTPQEVLTIMRASGPKERAAHKVAEEIEGILKERGDDVTLIKREVIKLRAIGKGLPFEPKEAAELRQAGDIQGADMLTLKFLSPSLGDEDALAVLAKLEGKERDPGTALDAIRVHFADMGPVEFVTLPPEAV